MEISKLTLALALELFLSSNVLAGTLDSVESQSFSANGFIAGASVSGQNKVNYPRFEAGLGVSYQANDYLGFHGSLNMRDETSKVDTLYTELESKIFDSPFSANVQVGRNRTYIGLNNYARFYPAARSFIIAPQGIYWASMDELVGSSTGIRMTVKHESGFALQGGQSSVDIDNSVPINESTFIPGKISKARIALTGVTYTSRSIYAGLQHIDYQFRNSLTGILKDPSLSMNLYFVKIHDCENELSLEWMDSSSSLNKLDGNSRRQQAYSVTYSRTITEDLIANFNYNKTTYNHEKELSWFPYKNTTTEKIVGLTFRNVGIKNLSVKVEEHFVNGVSWLTSDMNPAGMKGKWNMTALQAIYEF